jgi:hypothetical protein
MEEPVRVFVRVRPPEDSEKHARQFKRCVGVNGNTLKLSYPREVSREFVYDGIFGEAAAELEVFRRSAMPLIDTALEGYHGVLFVYGQTGTGKTHTLGLNRKVTFRAEGIVPRTLRHLFERLPGGSISLSFMQLYQENVYDLLNSEHRPLALREDAGQVFVQNLIKVPVSEFTQAANLINAGLNNRVTAHQSVNHTSSRSHVMLTLNLDLGNGLVSKLTLIDLAGSERVRSTKTTGVLLEEAKFINASLSSLGKVVSALAVGSAGHIPYRDSKLTRLLQPSLTSGAKVVLIATVGPSFAFGGETLSTLQFASRCRQVLLTPAPEVQDTHEDYSTEGDREDLMFRIRELEAQQAVDPHNHEQVVSYIVQLLRQVTDLTSSTLQRVTASKTLSQGVQTVSPKSQTLEEELTQLPSSKVVGIAEEVSATQLGKRLTEDIETLCRLAQENRGPQLEKLEEEVMSEMHEAPTVRSDMLNAISRHIKLPDRPEKPAVTISKSLRELMKERQRKREQDENRQDEADKFFTAREHLEVNTALKADPLARARSVTPLRGTEGTLVGTEGVRTPLRGTEGTLRAEGARTPEVFERAVPSLFARIGMATTPQTAQRNPHIEAPADVQRLDKPPRDQFLVSLEQEIASLAVTEDIDEWIKSKLSL